MGGSYGPRKSTKRSWQDWSVSVYLKENSVAQKGDSKVRPPCKVSNLAMVGMWSPILCEISCKTTPIYRLVSLSSESFCNQATTRFRTYVNRSCTTNLLEEDEAEGNFSQSVPLDEGMVWDRPSPQPLQREVHVHHHYHAKLAPKQNKASTIRRASQRRTVMGTGAVTSPGSSTPSTPTTRPHRFASSPVIPLHLHQPQPQPQPRRNRWSVHSSTTHNSTISSLPSSPQSYFFDQNSSVFDRIDADNQSSRPTSPESAAGYFFTLSSQVSRCF